MRKKVKDISPEIPSYPSSNDLRNSDSLIISEKVRDIPDFAYDVNSNLFVDFFACTRYPGTFDLVELLKQVLRDVTVWPVTYIMQES